MKQIIVRIKAEPLALRAVVASVLNLLVVAGVIDTGASVEAQTIVLGAFNLLLMKGARDRVSPSGPPA